jgi:hypothetical protein
MRNPLPLIALLGAIGCRDRVDRKELDKATALANQPLPSSAMPADPKCPAGAEVMGAPRPRGPGMWCQKIDAGRITIFRPDGKLWADGAVDDNGLQGEIKFYAPDGSVALVRKYKDNNRDADGVDDVRVEGVNLPPTIAPVCYRNYTGDSPATTTKCPPEAGAPAAAQPTCPPGRESLGSPKPDGPGIACQEQTKDKLKLFRLDGKLWGEGSVLGDDLDGDFTFYAPDGGVALVRRYRLSEKIKDDVRIEGVDLPPMITPVCYRDWTPMKTGTTTKCPAK